MFCFSCGTQVKEGERFCAGCGQAISVNASGTPPEPTERPCTNCGKVITPGKQFCKHCGHAAATTAPVVRAGSPVVRQGLSGEVTTGIDLPSAGFPVEAIAIPVTTKSGSSVTISNPAVSAPVSNIPRADLKGHSKLKTAHMIAIVMIVLLVVFGFWGWRTYYHRNINLGTQASTELPQSATPPVPPVPSQQADNFDFASIVGKQAFDVIELPPIKSKLVSLLDAESLKEFKARLQVAGPVIRQGEWLVGNGLAPHSGGSDEAAFAINSATGTMFTVMMTDGRLFKSFGVDDPTKLPAPLLTWYRERSGSLTQEGTSTGYPNGRKSEGGANDSTSRKEETTTEKEFSSPSSSKAIIIPSGVMAGNLIQKTQPIYPPIAKAARVQGTVVLQAKISKTGSIDDLRVVSGPAMLQQAALDAVKTWRYKPYVVNNEPLEVATTVNVIFALGN